MNDTAEVRQVGNLFPDSEGFRNKTSGRVYSADGIAPTLNTAEGGGRTPYIVEADSADTIQRR